MSNRENIQRNLIKFKQRYWFARLLQGLLIFSGTGLVFFGIVALLEYASWLNVSERTVLFTLTVAIELVLFLIYLGWPSLQLLLNGKKLSDKIAAQIIGSKIEGVEDKLLNYLELQGSPINELIDAGIEQKGRALVSFPFHKAVSFSSLKPFLLFLIPPVVMAVYLLSGNRWHMFSEGADRLIHFDTEFKRSLPFTFAILSPLQIEEGTDYQLQLKLEGNIIPEQIALELNSGTQVLKRQGKNLFISNFSNCLSDIVFKISYDDIRSEEFIVGVIKKPVIGRIAVLVEPPAYTGISAFSVDNLREIDVPQGSNVKIRFSIKNAVNKLFLTKVESVIDTISETDAEGYFQINVKRRTSVLALAENKILGDVMLNAIKDLAPVLFVAMDSTLEGLNLSIVANDDYGITKASVILMTKDGTETLIALPVRGGVAESSFYLTYSEIQILKEIQVFVSDYGSTVTRVFELDKYTKPEQTNAGLLDAAGDKVRLMKLQEENSKGSLTRKENRKDNQLKQAEVLTKLSEQLVEKDSIQFERFRQLSKEIEDVLKKLEKNLPKAQQNIQEEKLEELLKQLEQEWAILKAIEQLKKLDEALEKMPAVDQEIMKDLQESKQYLEKTISDQKQKELDWKKFDDLQKGNQKLEENRDVLDSIKEKEKEQGNTEDAKKKESEEIKKEMKEDSDALKKQLSEMSDAMMMDAMEKNIALLRRLELRALKASLRQEVVYDQAKANEQVEISSVSAQKEIIQAASFILDSLEFVTIAEEELAMVLNTNVELLNLQLNSLGELQDISFSAFTSGQRYLQYGLNDLASVLYDILKSESSNLQNMMAGQGACKNPKPGKGKKKSLSQKQMELGEKMGKKKGKGEGEGEGKSGKQGRQSLSQGELLELIKGQEEIINEFKMAGGNRAGDKEAIEEMNKQLNDLLNNDIEKALERNKDIEDKLILIEKSQNSKNEEDDKRKSKENNLDYEAIRTSVFREYVRRVQTGSGVVNLPALKKYYIAKWVKSGL